MAGELSLKLPRFTIHVEDAVAHKVFKVSFDIISLAVVGEVGLEDVLDDGWVGGEDLLSANARVEDEGSGGGDLEDV
jgi:hypothetical protein